MLLAGNQLYDCHCHRYMWQPPSPSPSLLTRYLIWIYLNFKFKLRLFEMIWLIIFLNFPIWFECIWHSNINWHNLKWFDWLCALIFLFDLNLFDFQILNEIIWTNLICLISVDEKFDLNQVEILVFLNLFDLIWRVARKLRK